MEKAYNNCQSCGMPMKRDEQGGKFTLPDITAAGMQQRVKDKLRELGFPRFIAWFFARGVPKLVRWKN
jgi:predicted RNA-binding Zn-ribbon protein involved in translation (DUF1610 family)